MVLMTSPGNLPNHYRRFADNLRMRMRGVSVVLVEVPAEARTTCPSIWMASFCGRESKIRPGMGCNYSVYKVPTSVVRLSRNNFLTDFVFSNLAGSSFPARSIGSIRTSGRSSSVPASPGTPPPAIHRPSRRNRIAVHSCRIRSHIARFSSSVMNTHCETSSAVRPHPLQTSSNNVEHTPTQGLSGKS